jgi:isoprenylcysteine carboxyl methyltransferase (ICMT) family protein YpbQ
MVKQRVCELCISVPNQKSVVRIHVYQFGSKADITDITFHQYIYISKDSSVRCCKKERKNKDVVC